jgi:hypothetical protein
MIYAVEMCLRAMMHISTFIKIGSGIQKVCGGTHRQQGDVISLILFFQNKGNRLITNNDSGSIVPESSLRNKMVAELIKNYATLYGTRKFIAMFTRSSYSEPDESCSS